MLERKNISKIGMTDEMYDKLLSKHRSTIEQTIQLYDNIVEERDSLINVLETYKKDISKDKEALKNLVFHTMNCSTNSTIRIVRETIDNSKDVQTTIKELIAELDKALTLFNAKKIKELRKN